MLDIYEVFEGVLSNARSIDMAESEFKRQLCDDPELRTVYRDWCSEEGTSEKNGFVDYCLLRELTGTICSRRYINATLTFYVR